jgi:predicted Zn finger-like uncharacterized protein
MLITRCPHCGTAFKVVPDQLRLGQGWVKCGRCKQAFRAEQHFVQTARVDIDTDTPVTPTTPDTPSQARQAAQAEPARPEKIMAAHDDASHPTSLLASTQNSSEAAHEGPQTLLPVDALDEVDASNAIDELVALGAMRAAGTIVASDASSPADMYATTMPLRSGFMDSYAVTDTQASQQTTAQTDIHGDTANSTSLFAPNKQGDTADTDTDTAMPFKPEPSSSLEDWRKNKSRIKFKPPRSKLKKIQIADQELAQLQEQVNKPTDAPMQHGGTTVMGATKPWHPQDAADKAEDEPSFVAQALSRERWQRWPVRLGLITLLTVGCVAATAQLAYLNRHYLAANVPDAAPTLVQLCEPVLAYTALPCDILPLKRIDNIRVDSHTLASELSTDTTASPTYVMNITLKNQGDVAHAWPALEIAFTDISGSLQARRVLQARDYVPATVSNDALAQGIKPRDEQRVAVRFEAPSLRVGGYEITAFYP